MRSFPVEALATRAKAKGLLIAYLGRQPLPYGFTPSFLQTGIALQAAAILCGAPFVYLCVRKTSELWVMVWLTVWGLFKGLCDANIFASLFDVVTPHVRGTAAGVINMVGWLGGGGLAPVLIGYIAQCDGPGFAISCSAAAYVTPGLPLITVLAKKEVVWRVFL